MIIVGSQFRWRPHRQETSLNTPCEVTWPKFISVGDSSLNQPAPDVVGPDRYNSEFAKSLAMGTSVLTRIRNPCKSQKGIYEGSLSWVFQRNSIAGFETGNGNGYHNIWRDSRWHADNHASQVYRNAPVSVSSAAKWQAEKWPVSTSTQGGVSVLQIFICIVASGMEVAPCRWCGRTGSFAMQYNPFLDFIRRSLWNSRQ